MQVDRTITHSFLKAILVLIFLGICFESIRFNGGPHENTGHISVTRANDAIPTDCLPGSQSGMACIPLGEIQKLMDEDPDVPGDVPASDDLRTRREGQI